MRPYPSPSRNKRKRGPVNTKAGLWIFRKESAIVALGSVVLLWLLWTRSPSPVPARDPTELAV